MSCDAIATASARVPLELPDQLATMLDQQTVQTVMIAHLQNAFGEATSYPTYNPNDIQVATRDFIFTRSRPLPQLAHVHIQVATRDFIFTYSAGNVTAKARFSWVDQDQTDQATQALVETLRQAAGYLLQQKITLAVSRFAWIEGSETAANGARVITINM